MTILEINPNENGGHRNQSMDGPIPLPDGWAVLPESIGTPETLENFPFGDITVEDADGAPTVTSWMPLPVPEPEPGPAPVEEEYTAEDAVKALIGG